MVRRSCIIAGLALLVVGIPAVSGSTPPEGPVTIQTAIDFSSFPFSGTFVVTEGAGLLGCNSGTFVDLPAGVNPPSGGAIAKVLTCTNGEMGEFTVNFQPFTGKPGPGDGNGNWNITSGTGAFDRLHGRGDFSLASTGPTTGEETLTGKLHFD